jgi:uncharacterized membrane protein
MLVALLTTALLAFAWASTATPTAEPTAVPTVVPTPEFFSYVKFNGTVTIRFLNASVAFSEKNANHVACERAFTRSVELASQTSDVLSTSIASYDVIEVSRLNTIESIITYTTTIVALDAPEDDYTIFQNEFNNRVDSGQFALNLESRAETLGCDEIEDAFATDATFDGVFVTTASQTAAPTVMPTPVPTVKGENKSIVLTTTTIIVIVVIFAVILVIACYLQSYLKRRRKHIKKFNEAESLGRDPINLEQQHIENVRNEKSLNEMNDARMKTFSEEDGYLSGSPRRTVSSDIPVSARSGRSPTSTSKYGINRSTPRQSTRSPR